MFAGGVVDKAGDQTVCGQRDLAARRQRYDVDAVDEPAQCPKRRLAIGAAVMERFGQRCDAPLILRDRAGVQLNDGAGASLEPGQLLFELGPFFLLGDQLLVRSAGRRAVSDRFDKPPDALTELGDAPAQLAALAAVRLVQPGALGAVLQNEFSDWLRRQQPTAQAVDHAAL